MPFPDASANEVAPEDSSNFQSAARKLSGPGASVSEKFRVLPFRLADTTAAVLALTAGALAINSPAADPAAITTDDGIVTLAVEVTPVFTVSPPAGAGADTVTVHVAESGIVTVAGEQTSPVTA